jgi:hypothetical protein
VAPHLHAYLVDEDDGALGAVDIARQLAQGLAHQPRLCPHLHTQPPAPPQTTHMLSGSSAHSNMQQEQAGYHCQ